MQVQDTVCTGSTGAVGVRLPRPYKSCPSRNMHPRRAVLLTDQQVTGILSLVLVRIYASPVAVGS